MVLREREIDMVNKASILYTPNTESISVGWGFHETDNTTKILMFVLGELRMDTKQRDRDIKYKKHYHVIPRAYDTVPIEALRSPHIFYIHAGCAATVRHLFTRA